MDFLLHALRPGARADVEEYFRQEIHSLAARGLDWARLESLAQPHGLLPMLYPAVAGQPQGYIPDEVLERWRDFALLSELRSLRLTQELLGLQALLSRNRIEMLALRGPALAALIYPGAGLRLFSDLDILVQPENFPEVYDLLVSEEFQPVFPLKDKERSWITRGDRNFSFCKETTILEVHWSIEEPAFRYPLKLQDFWQSRRSVRLLEGGGWVDTLGVFEMLLHLCLHGARHRWEKLVWLADLAWFAQSNLEFDWLSFWERVQSLGFCRVCGFSLLLAQELVGLALPDRLSRALREDVINRRLAGGVALDLLHPPGSPRPALTQSALNDLRYALLIREGLLPKAYLVLDRLFTPRQSEWRSLHLPGILYPLYYVYRPLRLLWNVFRQVI
jgi:hypothetical protein